MELNIREYVRLIAQKWWLIACIVIIGCAVTYWYQANFVQPVYRVTAKMMLDQSTAPEETGMISFDAVRTNLMMLETYREIMRSDMVLDEVARQHPEFELSGGQLAGMLHVVTMPESQVITIEVTDEDSERAALIANAVPEVFEETLFSLFGVNNVTMLNVANPDTTPSPMNQNLGLSLLVGFIASFLLGAAIVTVLEYRNDTFRREEEVERYLGIPAVGIVPQIRKKDCVISSANTTGRVGDRNRVSAKA